MCRRRGDDFRRPPGREPDAAGYASKVADGYHLLPVEPKVTGTMSAEVGKDGRVSFAGVAGIKASAPTGRGALQMPFGRFAIPLGSGD